MKRKGLLRRLLLAEREAVMADQERRAGQTTGWSNVLAITHPSRVKRNFNGWSHNPLGIKIKTKRSAITNGFRT